jgi:predicted transcriptional regulator
MPSPKPYFVSDPEQVAALTSPVRQEVLDVVIARQGCTVREIAETLGRPADGLYYHLKALVQVGLLREEPGDDPARGTRYAAPTRGIMYLEYRPEDADHSAAVRRVVGSMLRAAERNFSDGLSLEGLRPSGPDRNLNASRQRAWLDREQRREVNRLLARLQAILHEGCEPGAGELTTLTFVLAPMEASPVRRSTDEE